MERPVKWESQNNNNEPLVEALGSGDNGSCHQRRLFVITAADRAGKNDFRSRQIFHLSLNV